MSEKQPVETRNINTSNGEDQRIEDVEKAHMMALRADPEATSAAKHRADAAKTIGRLGTKPSTAEEQHYDVLTPDFDVDQFRLNDAEKSMRNAALQDGRADMKAEAAGEKYDRGQEILHGK